MNAKAQYHQSPQTFLGTVRPITNFEIEPQYKYKLVLPDGTSYQLLADTEHLNQLKMELWEIFQIEGVLLPDHTILVKDLILHSSITA